MARKPEWQADIEEMMGHERWALRGPLSLIKVKPAKDPVVAAVGGYFSTASTLHGLTVSTIEARLGFEAGYLGGAARIYTFARLPGRSEYTYELTSRFPDGLAYVEWASDPRFPPGIGHAHQWCVRRGVEIPVLSALTVVIGATERYRAPS